MAAPYVVPFNFQPQSVAVKTASYTIPAGKYARVVVNLEGSATFTIDAVTALRGTQNSVLGTSPLATWNNGASGSADDYVLSTGTPGTGVNSAGAAFSSVTDQKSVVAEYWLPPLAVINGTGTWRAVVMEYNNIT